MNQQLIPISKLIYVKQKYKDYTHKKLINTQIEYIKKRIYTLFKLFDNTYNELLSIIEILNNKDNLINTALTYMNKKNVQIHYDICVKNNLNKQKLTTELKSIIGEWFPIIKTNTFIFKYIANILCSFYKQYDVYYYCSIQHFTECIYKTYINQKNELLLNDNSNSINFYLFLISVLHKIYNFKILQLKNIKEELSYLLYPDDLVINRKHTIMYNTFKQKCKQYDCIINTNIQYEYIYKKIQEL